MTSALRFSFFSRFRAVRLIKTYLLDSILTILEKTNEPLSKFYHIKKPSLIPLV